MRRRVLVLLAGLSVSIVAWADPPPSSATVSPSSIAKVNQRVAQHQAELAHLQQDVGQQESTSREAAERLQQQDRTIEQLKQQLKAAQEAPQKPATGH